MRLAWNSFFILSVGEEGVFGPPVPDEATLEATLSLPSGFPLKSEEVKGVRLGFPCRGFSLGFGLRFLLAGHWWP